MNSKNLDKLVSTALAIEAEAARDAGAIGYMARALVQATMPHRQTDALHHKRTNGTFELMMAATDPDVGLPYGAVPRLLIAFLVTEAVRTKEREIQLGDSMSAFMRELGLVPTGGRWGDIYRLKDQTRRLLGCAIRCSYTEAHQNADVERSAGMLIADESSLWWPRQPEAHNQRSLFKSSLTLSERFFDEVTNYPVPIDMRALTGLKSSALALDIYVWLTYRVSYLKKSTEIPWPVLQLQFGSNYPVSPQGTRDFKKKFLQQLRKVRVIYPDLNLETSTENLTLKPSRTHIATA